MSKRSPIHVCSLSMSPLTEATNKLKEATDQFNSMTQEDREKDQEPAIKVNRLRWLTLSLEYNRQTKLQFVFQHLGNKGNSPQFRQVKMRPLFKAWKREILRQRWQEVGGAIGLKSVQGRLNKTKESFAKQRAQISSESISMPQILNNAPVLDLIAFDDSLSVLDAFQAPSSMNVEFQNKGFEYLQSSACKTFSEMPTAEEEVPAKDPEILERLKSRGITQDEPEEKIMSGAERAMRSYKKKEVEAKSKGISRTIIIGAIIVILIAAFIFFFKGSASEPVSSQDSTCQQPTPKPKPTIKGKATPKPTPTPKPTRTPKPTPTPTPKKGWFSKK